MLRPDWFFENGCELCKPSPDIFFAVFMATNGNPCDGCNCKDTCPAFPLITHPAAKAQPTKKVETNADIAERLGVSKRQVAKMRQRGEL